VPRTWADVSAAHEALGYAPRVGFEEGIHRFASWLREQP
jgi:nucleoside-diphosphate-sugar epimerase